MNSASISGKRNSVADPIAVGGVTPFTTIDYPRQLAAVLFLQGCPWRCHYCHNAKLLDRKESIPVPWVSILDFLKQRGGLIDAVVFSGGEPTLQSGLTDAVRQVRRMGFRVGLHTAGCYPDRLQKLLPWIDWVGLDIKASKTHYAEVTGVRSSGENAWRSARIVVESGVDYEIRTTVHPRLMDRDRMTDLVHELADIQVENYAVQECVQNNCLRPDYRGVENFPFDARDIDNIARRFARFELRKTD
jgi:pyruvate formate lyase activating enzyme